MNVGLSDILLHRHSVAETEKGSKTELETIHQCGQVQMALAVKSASQPASQPRLPSFKGKTKRIMIFYAPWCSMFARCVCLYELKRPMKCIKMSVKCIPGDVDGTGRHGECQMPSCLPFFLLPSYVCWASTVETWNLQNIRMVYYSSTSRQATNQPDRRTLAGQMDGRFFWPPDELWNMNSRIYTHHLVRVFNRRTSCYRS